MQLLVVDDDLALLKLLRVSLEARGHAVLTRTSGLGVVNILAGWNGAQARPDICILDNVMPEITGMAILSLAARTASARHVPIILHSANASLGPEVEATGHPAAHFLLKGRVSDVVALVQHFETFGSFPETTRTT